MYHMLTRACSAYHIPGIRVAVPLQLCLRTVQTTAMNSVPLASRRKIYCSSRACVHVATQNVFASSADRHGVISDFIPSKQPTALPLGPTGDTSAPRFPPPTDDPLRFQVKHTTHNTRSVVSCRPAHSSSSQQSHTLRCPFPDPKPSFHRASFLPCT